MPKALIVGTSNSVRGGGYVKHLADQLGGEDQIRNASLGASASTHVIRSLRGVDFADYDYCVIDLSVNEDVLLRAGAMEPETSRIVVDAVVGAALAAGCLPIILILPRRLSPSQPPEGLPLHLEHARRWKLPVFDGYKLIAALKAEGGFSDDLLFRNSAHIENWVAEIVGLILGDFMVAQEASRWATERQTIRFASLGEAPVCSPERPGLPRATSKFSGVFFRVEEGADIEVDCAGLQAVLGLAVNLAHTHGVVRIAGEDERLLDLRSRYFDNPDFPLVISSLPLSSPLRPNPDGRVRIGVGQANALRSGETLHSAVEELGESAHAGAAQLEIEAVQGVLEELERPARSPSEAAQVEIFVAFGVSRMKAGAETQRQVADPEAAQAKAAAKRERKRGRMSEAKKALKLQVKSQIRDVLAVAKAEGRDLDPAQVQAARAQIKARLKGL